MKPISRVFAAAPAAAVFIVGALIAPPAQAQFGTGGVTGSTGSTGTIAATDLFLSVQKTKGTNLTQRDQARFLNHAHCACNDPVWLQAAVLTSAQGKALAVDPSAVVSAYVGSSCDQATLRPACKFLGSMQMSQFRAAPFRVETTVGEIAKYRIQSGVTSTGGATGTGGAGTGGSGGSGDTGTGGVSGTGGASGSGGATVTVSTAGPCDTQFTQTFWLFIGTAGEGDGSLGGATLPILMDVQAPAAPALAPTVPGHQALTLNWPALASTDAADLLGYQILCTRGDFTQVFKTGDFTPAFDSCADETAQDGNENSVPWPRPDGRFVCSGLLGPSSKSYRLKILENEVDYKVAVAAIDKQGNASIVTPQGGRPILTHDFYYEYRHNDPQGSAEGGYCAVAEGAPSSVGLVAGLGLLTTLGLVTRARRQRRSRRQP